MSASHGTNHATVDGSPLCGAPEGSVNLGGVNCAECRDLLEKPAGVEGVKGAVLAGLISSLNETTVALIDTLQAQRIADGEAYCTLFDALSAAVAAGSLAQADDVLRHWAPMAEQFRARSAVE